MAAMKALILTIAACLALLVAGCGGGSDSSSSGSTAGGETSAAESSGGEKTKPNEVTVQYVGVDYKNGKEFDSSWSRNEPFSFTLGAGEVIPGWDQGVEGMKVGGRRELIIPPNLAYGEAGAPPAIGPNETLVFVIDLLEVG
jgi:peptidylprolyl isomerase